MYQYRQIIHCMRMGQSDRTIAQSRLIGRIKCAQVRAVALEKGWLGEGPLPDDTELAQTLAPAAPVKAISPTGPGPLRHPLRP